MMKAEGFISGRIRFKGNIAVAATAVSFFIMIIAVAISGGFRNEIHRGVTDITGDVMLTGASFNYYSEDNPVSATPSYLDKVKGVKGVESVSPAIFRAGIVKTGEDIQGVLIKGIPTTDTTSLQVRIPSSLAATLKLKVGDPMLTYFVGERVKVRKFTVSGIYDNVVDTDEGQIVYASLSDLQRLNGWEEDEVTALEVKLDGRRRSRGDIRMKSIEIGSICSLYATEEDDRLIAVSSPDKYSRIFDWLDLIDFNVAAIILLMTIVAGFNMISGLLILLFRNISTIGTLKAFGMTDKGIAGVFLRVSARIVAMGMLIGNAAALLFCLIQGTTHLIKLNPENYFVSFVPVCISVPSVLIADICAFAGIMLLLLIPTLFISKVDPAQTMRTE